MAYNNVFRSLECNILNESGKAVQVSYTASNGLLVTEWYPKSQLNGIFADQGVIMASEWILKQKNAMHLSKSVDKPKIDDVEKYAPVADKPVNNFSDMDDDIPF